MKTEEYISYLIKTVGELKEEVEALKNRVTELEKPPPPTLKQANLNHYLAIMGRR